MQLLSSKHPMNVAFLKNVANKTTKLYTKEFLPLGRNSFTLIGTQNEIRTHTP